jgi:heme-degrading monooxygenase HmoA
MITLIAEHWFKADIAETAVEIFLANDKKLRDAGGMVSRLVLTSREDPTKITTVTTWESTEGYDRFMAELAKREAVRDPDASRNLIDEKLEGYVVNSAT